MTEGAITPSWGKDLAVLKAIYKGLESADQIDADGIVAASGLDRDFVWDSVDLWMQDGCLAPNTVRASGLDITVFRTNRTPKGMRLVGAWPTSETMPELLEQALRESLARTEDPEKRSRLREILDKWTGPEAFTLLIEAFSRSGLFPG